MFHHNSSVNIALVTVLMVDGHCWSSINIPWFRGIIS